MGLHRRAFSGVTELKYELSWNIKIRCETERKGRKRKERTIHRRDIIENWKSGFRAYYVCCDVSSMTLYLAVLSAQDLNNSRQIITSDRNTGTISELPRRS
jgi:hypothetical protein